MDDLRGKLERDGAVLCPGVLEPGEVATMIAALGRGEGTVARKSGVGYAARNVLQNVPEVAELAGRPAVAGLLNALMGPGAFAVRAILFDKVAGANWPVGWHQDLAIAVKGRVDAPGYGPWSVKAGVTHVRPPVWVLMGMLALRVHLDDCPEENGALRVMPGSQQKILGDAEIDGWVAKGTERVMPARAGDVLAMRPLVLHASSAAVRPTRRRVLHVEFAKEGLGGGVGWYEER